MSFSLRRGLASAAAVATVCGAALALAVPAQASPKGVGQCGAKDLTVTARYNDAGMGKAYWRVEFASNGAICTLQGAPTNLVFADARGRALNLEQERRFGDEGSVVTIAPGRPGHVLVRTRLDGRRLPAVRLLLTLPNSTERVETAWPEAIAGPVGVTEVRSGDS